MIQLTLPSLGSLSILSSTLLAGALSPVSVPTSHNIEAQELPTIEEKTARMVSQEGLIPIHYDPEDGRIYLEVSLPGEQFLYNTFSANGAGVAFSRGQPSWVRSEALVRFERYGSRLFLVQENTGVRGADSEGMAFGELAKEAFPQSLQGSFPIVAGEGGRVLIDGTDYFLREAPGSSREIASWLGEADFRLSPSGCSINPAETHASGESTEIETLLTFVTDQPGRWAVGNLPDYTTVVVRERHSLRRLPPPGFRPRRGDPRIGFNSTDILELRNSSLPYSRTLRISRWRLERSDPEAPASETVRPILFYLDSAMPDVVRKGAEKGIQYWERAFTSAGIRGAIEIRDLPPDADPLDPRFPIVVLWSPGRRVSMGPSVVDPRTGEVLKGLILLDGYTEKLETNRYKAFEPLLEAGQPSLETFLLARRAWIVAHEAGHVLAGLAHNDIVPTVMGFRRPRFAVNSSSLIEMDVSVLFPPDPFPYDEWMIRYAYTPFGPEEEQEGLRRIVEEGLGNGLRYIDASVREANPRATGRIHSDNPMAVLVEDMQVRRIALDGFGSDMLGRGEPTSLLFDRLIPIYLHHWYSLEAAAKEIGGVDFTYGIKGDGQAPLTIIPSSEQRRALELLIHSISPEELLIPSRIADMIPPRPEALSPSELEEPGFGWPGFTYLTGSSGPIHLPLSAGGVFNPLDWARTLCRRAVTGLLDGERLARVAALQAARASDLSIHEILDRIVQGTWGMASPEDPTLAPLRRIARLAVLDGLADLAQSEASVPEVREPVLWVLRTLLCDLRQREPGDPAERAHLDAAIRRITEIV